MHRLPAWYSAQVWPSTPVYLVANSVLPASDALTSIIRLRSMKRDSGGMVAVEIGQTTMQTRDEIRLTTLASCAG
jgi:hypothetical protein